MFFFSSHLVLAGNVFDQRHAAIQNLLPIHYTNVSRYRPRILSWIDPVFFPSDLLFTVNTELNLIIKRSQRYLFRYLHNNNIFKILIRYKISFFMIYLIYLLISSIYTSILFSFFISFFICWYIWFNNIVEKSYHSIWSRI